MKILWYVNIVMPDAADRLGLPVLNVGGWLEGQAKALSDKVQLTIATVSSNVKETKEVYVSGVNYIVYPACNDVIVYFSRTISEVQPDIVHIHGTEYKYNTDIIEYCNRNNIKNVVSIQGLAFECAKHYFDGLPEKYKKVNPIVALMKKVYTAESIAIGQQGFAEQGENEIKALKTAKNVIGRTHWDKNCVISINPDVNYFHVNENLREEFYTGKKWDYDKCEKHSIFISQAFYPIKGFHQIIPALAELTKSYPDLKVYVGGYLPYTLNNKFLDIFVDYFFEYQGYIKKLIRKHGLQDKIIYTGPLSAQQMKERFLSANVFVSPSTIENSPNSVGEAMILGTPVVASNVGGVATMLTDGKDGILYDFYDVKKFTSAVCEIFDNRQKSEFYSENLKKHAIETHDIEQNTNSMLNTYKIIFK